MTVDTAAKLRETANAIEALDYLASGDVSFLRSAADESDEMRLRCELLQQTCDSMAAMMSGEEHKLLTAHAETKRELELARAELEAVRIQRELLTDAQLADAVIVSKLAHETRRRESAESILYLLRTSFGSGTRVGDPIADHFARFGGGNG